MKAAIKRLCRLRPLAVTAAMVMIDVASKDATVGGFVERVIQFALAYTLVAWAMNGGKNGRAE